MPYAGKFYLWLVIIYKESAFIILWIGRECHRNCVNFSKHFYKNSKEEYQCKLSGFCRAEGKLTGIQQGIFRFYV